MEESLKRDIKDFSIFVVLGTKNYFDNIPKDQVDYAKSLNKPFRVLVQAGVYVPDWFKEGVVDYKQRVVDLDKENLENLLNDDLKTFLTT